MTDYRYVAWFRDRATPFDDEDHEWCACLIIAAASGDAARAWGDRLAQDHARRAGYQEFLHSHLDPDPWPLGDARRIVAREPVADEDIGW